MDEEIVVIHTASRYRALYTIHCSLSWLTLLLWYFKGFSNQKHPEWNSWFPSSVSYSSSNLLHHSTWFHSLSNCLSTQSTLDASFFPTPRFQMVPQFYQLSFKNVSWNSCTFFCLHYHHLDITMTTTIIMANVYWCVLSSFYILTHYNIVRRWILSETLWNEQKRSFQWNVDIAWRLSGWEVV